MWLQFWPGWVASADAPLNQPAPAKALPDFRDEPVSRPQATWHWEFYSHPAVVASLRDTEGRPLGERGFAFAWDVEGVPFELRECPYPGSRHRHEKSMNVSALRQLTTHWQEFRAALEFLRNRYFQKFPPRHPDRVSVSELWQLSRMLVRLPQYLHRRALNGVPNGELSPVVASMLKVVLGADIVFEHLAIRELSNQRPLPDDITTQFIIDYTEEHGLFINLDGVCAGPPKMISEFFDALIGGAAEFSGRDPDHFDIQLGDAAREVDVFLTYAREDGRLKLLVNALQVQNTTLGLKLLAECTRRGMRSSSGPWQEKLDAFEGVLKLRAPPFLQCLDEDGMASLARGLEREAAKLALPGHEVSPTPPHAFVRELTDVARDDGVDDDSARFLVETLADYLVIERDALRRMSEAEGRISELTGEVIESALDEIDIDAACGPTIGALVGELLGMDVSNTARHTSVRSRRSGRQVSLG